MTLSNAQHNDLPILSVLDQINEKEINSFNFADPTSFKSKEKSEDYLQAIVNEEEGDVTSLENSATKLFKYALTPETPEWLNN